MTDDREKFLVDRGVAGEKDEPDSSAADKMPRVVDNVISLNGEQEPTSVESEDLNAEPTVLDEQCRGLVPRCSESLLVLALLALAGWGCWMMYGAFIQQMLDQLF